MVSLPKKRIKNVFDNALKIVSSGKPANIKGEMIKQGYSLSSAACQKVVRTKTWTELKEKYLNDERAVKTLNELAAKKNEDKDNRLKASIEILKLNDRYPKTETKMINLFTNIKQIEGNE